MAYVCPILFYRESAPAAASYESTVTPPVTEVAASVSQVVYHSHGIKCHCLFCFFERQLCESLEKVHWFTQQPAVIHMSYGA